MTGLDLDDDAETAAEHPIFRSIRFRGALSVSVCPGRCAQISGIPAAHVADTVARLFEHCTRDCNVHRHSWSPGDVVMWDNRCVLHCADHTGVVGDRVMHRGMVLSAGP